MCKDGSVWAVCEDGSAEALCKDNSVAAVYQDGSVTAVYQGSSVGAKDKDGSVAAVYTRIFVCIRKSYIREYLESLEKDGGVLPESASSVGGLWV